MKKKVNPINLEINISLALFESFSEYCANLIKTGSTNEFVVRRKV